MIVDRRSNLTIGSRIAAASLSNVTMMVPTSTNLLTTSLLGISANSISTSSSSSKSELNIDDGSSLIIGSSAVGTGSNVTMLAPSSGSSVTTAFLGVVVNSFSDHSSSRSTMTVDGNSNLTIGGSTITTVTMLAPSKKERVAIALLGVALNSHRGPSTLAVCGSCAIGVSVLLAEARTEASVQHATSVAAVAGIIVDGTGASVLSLGSNGDTVGASEVLDVWVGMQSQSQLSVGGTPGENNAVVLGLVAPRFDGLSSENTMLSLCIDYVTQLPSAFAGGEAVTMATKPQINGVEVSRTVGWSRDRDDANSEGITITSTHSQCTEKAAALQALLADSLAAAMTSRPTVSASLPLSPSLTSSVTESRTHTTAELTRSSSATLSTTETPTPHDLARMPTNEPQATANNSLPLLRKRTVRITASVLLPSNEAAATVVLSTAGASGAVASTLGSGGAGVVVTAGSSVRMMECGLAEGDSRPARFELPIQFPVGNGMARYFAGAAVYHTLLQCIMLAVPMLVRRKNSACARGQASTNRIMQTSALAFCGAHPFFTPAILGACSTVLFNDDDALSLAVAGSSSLVVVAIHGVVALAVHRGPANGLVTRRLHCAGPVGGKAKLEFRVNCQSNSTSSSSSTSSSDTLTTTSGSSNDSASTDCTSTTTISSDSLPPMKDVSFLFSAQATKDMFLPLFDGCRHFERASHRHYSSIETTVYSVIAIISGARPQQNCEAAAFAIGALAALQLAYIVFVRPLRTRLDMIFSILNAVPK